MTLEKQLYVDPDGDRQDHDPGGPAHQMYGGKLFFPSIHIHISFSKFSHWTILFYLGCGSGDLPNQWCALFGPFSDQFQV